MSKRVLIMALAGLNLLLLAGLVLTTHAPPQAFAQAATETLPDSQYLVIAAEAELANDAIYVLDAQNDFLYAFRTPFPRVAGVPVRLTLLDTHDLTIAFRREAPRR